MTDIDLRYLTGLGLHSDDRAAPRPTVAPTSPIARDLYRRPALSRHVGFLAVSDLMFALATVAVARRVVDSASVAAWHWVAVAIMWSLSMRASGAYVRSLRMSVARSRSTVIRAALYVCAALGLTSALPFGAEAGAAAVTTAVIAAVTLLGRRILMTWHRRTEPKPGAVVRGPARDVSNFLSAFAREEEQPFGVAAVQVTSGELPLADSPSDPYVLAANLDVVDHAIHAGLSTVVFVGAQPEDSESVRRMMWRLEGHGCEAYVVPVVADLAAPNVESLGKSGVPMLAFNSRDLGAEVGVTKVVIDKVLAFGGLVVLSPVLLAIVAAVKLTSPGPVLFRQERVGLGGKTFEMLKFRTMVVNAEELLDRLMEQNQHDTGAMFKMADDPRITRVGRFLRKFSLDELPQLINVVRGEMSLVGPRPCLPREVEHFELDAYRRFCVRPGLTGLWQVSGRSDLDPESSWRLDTHYVESWSPGADVAILARTPKAVISGDGAY